MKHNPYGEPEHCYMVENKWIAASKTEFIDISEDLFGYDVYEFKYNGKVYTSHAVIRYADE
jgi:hypothetical protein